MKIAMVTLSFLCIFLGIFPSHLYSILPFDNSYIPYTANHVVSQLHLLVFSGLAFFMSLKYLERTLTITLDIDWIYRNKLIFLDDDCIPEIYFLNKYYRSISEDNKIFCGLVKYPKNWVLKSNYLKYRQSTHFTKVDHKPLKPENIVVMNMGFCIKKGYKKKFFFDIFKADDATNASGQS